MRQKSLLIMLFAVLFQGISTAQITGFFDDFSDASMDTLWEGEPHTLWRTGAPSTYALTESDGVLNIGYTRTGESGANDNIVFAPPAQTDVSDNPKLRVFIKSSASTTLTLSALYQSRPALTQDFEREIPGDNQWHGYTFSFDTDIFNETTLKTIYLYFDKDGGSNSGTIQIDDFKLAGFVINVTDFTAETVEGDKIQLNWSSSDPLATDVYRIYRSTEEDFTPSQNNLITGTRNISFLNQGLELYTKYFYKIIPTDTLGEEYFASEEVSAETYVEFQLPEVTLQRGNPDNIPLYELFPLEVSLTNVGVYNPYDPDDLDLHAWFESPSGDTTRVNGFYDDYQNADQWKVYFSPNETGTWKYQVLVTDAGGTGSSSVQSFEAIDSGNNGPLRVSKTNPDYLEHDDGTQFYGLSVYYPWSVNSTLLNRLQQYELNMIGYWNGAYDNSGNGGGNRLIESMQTGLGRYDQQKLGRIEEILGMLEERDMKMMYAVWAHPFLRNGAPGWDPIHWPEYNPYQEIVDAEDFFTDSLAWEYQKKQYRYLIARLGHHKALGIWEIINEMHGTTGYIFDPAGAREWVNKVHDYFKENDPYQRPTTASFGSTTIWTQFDIKAEITNRHYYEGQGGYSRPFNDNIRDGLFNVVDVYQTLKRARNRPAMLGEAGYENMFSAVSSNDYTIEFHNAYWAGLATGMASTPFWWDYTTQSIFPDERMETYPILADFISDIDFTSERYEAASLEESGANIYYMVKSTAAFGWLFKNESQDVSATSFSLDGIGEDGSYAISWYNTWTGETEGIDSLASVVGRSTAVSPSMENPERDIAFKVYPIEDGAGGASLNIAIQEDEIKLIADSSYTIAAYITDASGRIAADATDEITFTLTGNGSLAASTVTAEGGIAKVKYTPDASGSTSFSVSAEAAGYETVSLNEISVTSNEETSVSEPPVEYFLQQNYPNPFNPSTNIRYSVPSEQLVSLEVYDITGRKVADLVNARQTAGVYTITFNAQHLASGVYIYRLTTGSFTETRKMILLK